MAGRSQDRAAFRKSPPERPNPRRKHGFAAAILFVLSQILVNAAFCGPVLAQPVSGEVKVTSANGFVRLVFTLTEEVESTVRIAGGILVVSFKRPVNIAVNRMSAAAPDYINAVRRDPDGTAIRMALGRKVTVNSMAAAERLFVDMLPENWSGLPPGLPAEVIEELARRARDAEKQLRAQRQQARPQPVARVRVSSNPSFTRYTFELLEPIPVTTERELNQLKVIFAAPVRIDLGDAKVALPPTVQSVDTQTSNDSALVRFSFIGKTDVRSFREDKNFVVDVGASDGRETFVAPKAGDPAPTAPEPANVARAAAAKPEPAKPEPAKSEPVKPEPVKPEPVKAEPARAQTPKPEPAKVEAAAREPKSEPKPEPKPEAAQARPVAAPATPAPAPPQTAAAPTPAAPPLAKPAADNAVAPSSSPSPAPPAPPAQVAAAANEPAPPAAEKPPRDPNALAVEVRRQGDNLRLIFPFKEETPAAIFRRSDTLWMVFDTKTKLDLSALEADTSKTVRAVSVTSEDGDQGTQVVRVQLERPRLTSAIPEDTSWQVTIGDTVADPARPLGISRNVAGRPSVTISFDQPRRAHRLMDPEIGDSLLVVTGHGPSRGFLKSQEFVEFRALASSHGVVIQPFADDLNPELSADKIVLARPGGLTLSGVGVAPPPSSGTAPAARNTGLYRAPMFDPQTWGFDRQANFNERQVNLMRAAAEAPPAKRIAFRVDLARFYFSRELFHEAKGVLDVTLADERANQDTEDAAALVMRAVANVLMDRADEAMKELSNPAIGNLYDAPIWRALALAKQGKWVEAREGFKGVVAAMSTLPIELQRVALKEALRAEIEVRDFASAAKQLNEFETIGVSPEMEPEIAVLSGRLAQGLGKSQNALAAYRTAAESRNRPAAAAGRLRDIVLRLELGEVQRKDAISELETLTVVWRGDDTELEALQLLGRLYAEEQRYRDSFYAMRTAMRAYPDSELTRKIYEEAAATFDSLFLGGKGDAMAPIDALALFYDFRELTPIGRRGDEMIRRLSDRLVSVDLLGQAAELLQHQVGHRLQGAARAQIATRLAAIYLMNRKPEDAQAVLRSTRVAELTPDLRALRLMLEARALSDIGRHDVALEVIGNLERREATRLRSDILWAARRYGDSAEQIELLYGERWKEWDPLKDTERADLLRAAIGYAIADDTIGLSRLREKYAAKMAESPDRRIFDIASAPIGTNPAEFREIAKIVAAVDTLDGFLRELRARHPEIGALSPVSAAPSNGSQKVAKSAEPAAASQ